MPFGRVDWCFLGKVAIVLWLGIPLSARAAEFSKSPSPNGGPDIIFAVGELTLGDENKFINVALSTGNAIVVFQSPGGNLVAGIEIGKAIHLKGFSTFVPDTVQCASACALAWLGGRVRFMSNTARVGFHAVYVDDGGQAAISSAGNALVGAYLNQLGLSASAIIYITGAPPQGMQWLNFADAQRHGIDVRAYDLTTPTAATQHNEPSGSFSSQVLSVKNEVYDFMNATNRPNDTSLDYLQGKYREQVNYFGKMRSKADVLKDKSAFFRKWPIRNYSIQSSSVAVTCEKSSECKAEGIVDWNVSNNTLNSVGSASFSMLWALEENNWKISSETSRTIGRKVSRLAPSESPFGQPAYQLDGSQTKVISLSNLFPSQDCTPRGSTAGTIARREFSKDGLKITGVVIEQSDGTREFVNVDVNLDNSDMVTRSWVMKGLQTLLAEGRSVHLDLRLCGAAGRVEMIDAIREQPSRSGG
jgi:hypothetical protein